MDNTKQVIMVRRDLGMTKGKIGAQASHASRMSVVDLLTQGYVRVKSTDDIDDWNVVADNAFTITSGNPAYSTWINGSSTTVLVWVDDLPQLQQLTSKAKRLGVPVTVITDEGRTQFDNTPTITCAAIGPETVSIVDAVTSGLKLV